MTRDEQIGAEKLRASATWIDHQNESFLERFTAHELVMLYEHGRTHDAEVCGFADTWGEEQIQEALRVGKGALLILFAEEAWSDEQG